MVTLALLLVLISLLIYIFKWSHNINQQWKRKGIKHHKPVLFFGNMHRTFIEHKHFSVLFEELCRDYPDEPMLGFYVYTRRQLLVQDADFIETILIKEFAHFMDRGIPCNEDTHPIDAQLFTMTGKRWRVFRNKLAPMFTTGKLKTIFETMNGCGEELDSYLQKTDKTALDIQQVMTLFTIDAIGSSIFGILPKALENPDSKFCQLASSVYSYKFIGMLKVFILFISPWLARLLNIPFNDLKSSDYICKIIKDTFEYRKKQNIQRNDFLQLMMNLKEKGTLEVQNCDTNDDYLLSDNEISKESQSYELTENIMMALAYSFLVNGLHPIGMAQAITLFELSTKLEIQQKVRKEINEQIKLNGGFTFNALKNMVYLENVVKESLRLHPTSFQLFRICIKEYTFPNGYTVEKGDVIKIPLTAIHKNPNYFPEPGIFKPERFETDMRPGIYLPFGDGPRICIAMRFSILLIKYGVAKVLQNYNVKLNPKTKVPLTLNPNSIVIMNLEQKLLLDLEKVDQTNEDEENSTR